MKRLFIAIKIHPDKGFFEEYRKLKSELRQESIKWVEEYNIHITLKFLGDTSEDRIPEITEIMEEAGKVTSPFKFSLKGLGIFGSKYDPRVIWIGIEPYQFLSDQMKLIREKCQKIGFEPDRQNLVPHLTIGRIRFLRDKKNFQQVIDKYRNLSSQGMIADTMILFESILKKEGPVYIPLKTVHYNTSFQ